MKTNNKIKTTEGLDLTEAEQLLPPKNLINQMLGAGDCLTPKATMDCEEHRTIADGLLTEIRVRQREGHELNQQLHNERAARRYQLSEAQREYARLEKCAAALLAEVKRLRDVIKKRK